MRCEEIIGFLEIIDIDRNAGEILRQIVCFCNIDAVAVGVLHGNGNICAAFDIRFCVAFFESQLLKQLYN